MLCESTRPAERKSARARRQPQLSQPPQAEKWALLLLLHHASIMSALAGAGTAYEDSSSVSSAANVEFTTMELKPLTSKENSRNSALNAAGSSSTSWCSDLTGSPLRKCKTERRGKE